MTSDLRDQHTDLPYSLVLHQSHCCEVKYSDKQIGFSHGNRPIQGYRRHFVKGAKPLGRAGGQTNSDAFEAFTMPKHARCCVGHGDNHKRFPNLLVVRSHIKELKFNRWPKEPNLAELWRKQVAKGRGDNFNPKSG